MERGIIRNREWAQQIKDFSGMRWGSITPTDIDMHVEVRGKLHILGESKYMGRDMKEGQRRALETLADDLSKTKPTILIKIYHDVPPGKDIYFADLPVIAYRENGQWHRYEGNLKLKQFCDEFIEEHLEYLPC